MVSVIVPNYNHASYLVARIESILNQTYQDFELILLDDCSTDKPFEVIEPFIKGDHRINFCIEMWIMDLKVQEILGFKIAKGIIYYC